MKRYIFSLLLIVTQPNVGLTDTSIDPYKYAYELGFSPQEIIIHEKIDVSKKARGILYFNEKATRLLAFYLALEFQAKSKFSPYVEEAQELYEKIRR